MSEARAKVHLLDLEGTVAPLSLTSEVLFPYARAHFEEFLWRVVPEMSDLQPGDRPDGTIFMDMMMLAAENQKETDPGVPRILPPEADYRQTISMSPAYGIPRILNYIYWLMDRDRKSTALKSLQGKIWKAGFESGELRGRLFEDVPDALKRWSVDGCVAIYSSGSVEAQQLLFRYSIFGDLTAFIAAYFDTRTGPKMESASYAAIAAAMNVAPDRALFFSDSVPELDAARDAGCGTRLVVRPGNLPVAHTHQHPTIESFDLL